MTPQPTNNTQKNPKTCSHHNVEYGQEASDFMKRLVQKRCVDCGWQTYTFFRSIAEALRFSSKKEKSNV